MTRRLRLACLAILLASALALPVTAAEPPVLDSDVSVSSVHVEESYRLEGPVQAFLQENLTDSCTASPAFILQADRLIVENDTTDIAFHPTDSYHSAFTYDPKTTREEHGVSLVKGVVNRAGCRWNLFPLAGSPSPRVELSGTCANSNPSDMAQVARAPVLTNTRNDTMVDTAKGLLWQDCSRSATVKITGDFQLSLWNWDAVLTDQDGSEAITTGPSRSPLVPSQAPDGSAPVSRDQETYLFVRNGILTTTLGGAPRLLYVGQTSVAAPSVQLQGATGHLSIGPTTQELRGNAVSLEGSVQLVLEGTGVAAPLDAKLTGTPTRFAVDGVMIPIAPSPGTSFLGKWGWMMGALGLVAIPAAAVPVVRRAKAARVRRLQALVEQCVDLLSRGHIEHACGVAQKILDLSPDNPRGHCLLAMSLAALGDFAGSLAHHRKAADLLAKLPEHEEFRGENAANAAITAATSSPLSENSHAEILAWLQEALQAKPSLKDELHRHPELRPYLRELGLAVPDDAAFA